MHADVALVDEVVDHTLVVGQDHLNTHTLVLLVENVVWHWGPSCDRDDIEGQVFDRLS